MGLKKSKRTFEPRLRKSPSHVSTTRLADCKAAAELKSDFNIIIPPPLQAWDITTSPAYDSSTSVTLGMDLKEDQLSLASIHDSIETTIGLLRKQHEEVQAEVGNPVKIKQVIEEHLHPICDRVNKHEVKSYEALRQLLSLHQNIINSSIVQSSRVVSPQDGVDETNKRNSESCFLPPVVSPQATATSSRPRSLLSFGIKYPAITHTLMKSPVRSREGRRISSPLRNTSLPCRTSPTSCDFTDAESASERHDTLQRYVDNLETHTCTLQATFSTFTQRVLLPLQTFCKQHRTRTKAQPSEETETNDKRCKQTKSSSQVHKSEFTIVQTMNTMKQLLWPTVDGVRVHLFSQDDELLKVLGDADFKRFPVTCLLHDVLQKFNQVLNCATLWLKCDKLVTENARCGLHRAHRRFIKTEGMWQVARQEHRHLLSEWEHVNAEVNTNVIRLENLERDVEMLRNNMSKAQDQRDTLEIKLRNASENVAHLRARHRAFRKRISFLDRKIEARERNYEFLESRVRSLKADQDAMQEKLRISNEYSASLQTKMQEFYNQRAAWERRYKEKTDPEVLRARLDAARLRIPLPALREKTFILKSRIENLREVLSNISERLEANNIHWSSLCYYLPWPDHFLLSLPDINTSRYPKDLTDSDDSSSASSTSSTSAGNSSLPARRPRWQTATARKVVKHVQTHCSGTELQQRQFMIDLWLRNNQHQATIEKLLHSLRSSRIPDLVTCVEQCAI